MGECLILKNGSAYGSNDCTAEQQHVLSGYLSIVKGSKNAPAQGTMANNGSVEKMLDPGGSYTVPKGFHSGSGKVNAKKKFIKQLAAIAYYGFNAAGGDYFPTSEDSFEMPADGIVYYNGMSGAYNADGNFVCAIYKNGAVVDSRNKEGTFVIRGTMQKKYFSAKAGDVIRVLAQATSGTATFAHIDATIEYFM